MYRKSTIAHTCVLLTILLGMLLAVPLASAEVVTNHSGTICKNYYQGEANRIAYVGYGARNPTTLPLRVICPLTRGANTSNGALVYVSIRHDSSKTTTCTAYSYTNSGRLLASASKTWTGNNFYDMKLDLVGKSQRWSDYSVLCTIPSHGVILGIDLIE